MSSQNGSIKAASAPELNLPKSSSTVQVSIINSTTDIVCPASGFVKPILKGQEFLNLPTFSFHVTHPTEGQILFDLGSRKDYWNFSPKCFNHLKKVIPGLKIDAGMDEILVEGGVKLEDIKSVIWSHWHWDHTGDMSKFPGSTELIVGPGFKKGFMPGYPKNPDAVTLQSDFEGREVREIEFSDSFKIGRFQAHDFFGDGSFYVLNVPGHAVGHISALARTTEDTFVFMGGDVCHFGGSFRPTEWVPMPENIPESVPLDRKRFRLPCPCSMFTECHPNPDKARTSPFYTVTHAEGSWYIDPPTAQDSIDKLEEFDASPNVFVCIAHDEGLQKVVDWFPNGTLNEWKKKGWKDDTQWGFLNAVPIGKDAETTKWFVPGLMKEGVRMKDWEEYKG